MKWISLPEAAGLSICVPGGGPRQNGSPRQDGVPDSGPGQNGVSGGELGQHSVPGGGPGRDGGPVRGRDGIPDPAALAAEYRAGRAVGIVTLGTRHLFFRRLWKAYYIPYDSISRFFRRVLSVPAKIGCCNTGEIQVENLVLCGLLSDGTERELAVIQLPGQRAALALVEELKRLAPGAAYGKPSPTADSMDANGVDTDNADADSADGANADSVNTDSVNSANADSADTDSVNSANADSVDTGSTGTEAEA